MRRNAARPRQQRLVQRGQVLLILLVTMIIGFGAAFYALVSPTHSDTERDKITTAALAQAKAALIGYAAGVSDFAGGERPGDLPCPDTNDSGAFGSPNCNTQASRIGRLPWKRLGLPDLRDGDGERLWYAVSNNFKKDARTLCAAPGDAGCLNSDARGTITVRDRSGAVIYDGSNPNAFTPSGVIAVIFAPGGVLQRQGAASVQDRSCTGGSCTPVGVCTSTPVTNTPKCNPINYLDILTGVEDNADFIDGSNANGFINGVIRDANGNVIVNDRLITITYQDLMPLLERRVAKETLNCLSAYASANNGRYPWATRVNDLSYQDKQDERFGRIPDGIPGNLLIETVGTSTPMADRWPTAVTACNMIRSTVWNNWKEMVFFGVADAYKPRSGLPPGGPCGSCLKVDPPSSASDKRVVVVVAGKRLAGVNGGQPRTSPANKRDGSNYLEGDNDNSGSSNTYEQQPVSASFNDYLLYQ